MQLIQLMNELAEQRRAEPTDDLTSALVHNDLGEDMLAPNEIGPFFILLAVAGNDTTRTAISHGMDLLHRNPDQRKLWMDDLEGVGADRGRGDRAGRVAGHVHAPDGDARHDGRRPRARARATRSCCSTAPPTATRWCSTIPSGSTSCATRTTTSASAGPGPHFCLGAHLARREVNVAFRQLLSRLPDIELAGPPVPLEAMGVPLVGGIKRLPVRFTPTAKVGS